MVHFIKLEVETYFYQKKKKIHTANRYSKKKKKDINSNEKGLNVTSHQGHANQNHRQIPSHTCRIVVVQSLSHIQLLVTHELQVAIIKKTRENKCGQGYGERES